MCVREREKKRREVTLGNFSTDRLRHHIIYVLVKSVLR